jgi:hypothetical protein
MLHALLLLLKIWPELERVKTDKDSNPLACVDMADKHHPTTARVLALLQEAKCKVDGSDAGKNVISIQGEDSVCVFLASGYKWVTVMHEIPISSAQLMTSLPYLRTQ